MKFFKWILDNSLFLVTLFLLIFIPLYPKLPLLDVVNTWVYVRVEDFIVTFAFLLWVSFILLKKITLKTPLTLPILMFWIAGGISTLHGVLLLFPTLSDVFANVAFLSFLRRMEYMSLFFIAYAGIKNKKFMLYVILTLAVVLLLVSVYGFGQKFFGFPAFLTMNEEFAKGVPIQLSQLSRVPSTFAGHYDLAAYLVLIIPILVSVAFGFRNWLIKTFLLISSSLGFVLLLMTVSRVSFFVLLLALAMLLVLQKKKLVIVSLSVLVIVFLSFSPRLLERFGSTVKEVDVLVDAKTGGAIGQVKEVPSSYFINKVVLKQFTAKGEARLASGSAIIVPLSLIPQRASLVLEPNSPNGENLPQGTSYINLPLSPVIQKTGQYFYQKSGQRQAGSIEVREFDGDFVIKKAKAYDLSFTTRFQGEWPRTLLAFRRNIFLGSGYGSVSLAVDNDYLRILGESGLFGFVSFILIFITSGIYIKKILQKAESLVVKSFVLGFIAGTFGLALNAVLIDVFEASKVAFVYWLLMGITLGILGMYKNEGIDFYKELKKFAVSSNAIVVYLLIFVAALFSSVAGFYFVGDDFTWFRWIADCSNCHPLTTIVNYFTQAQGSFYRPGTKVYFDFMYSAFWLNQTMYHFVSLMLHFLTAVLIFMISKRISKNLFLSFASAVLFLMLSGYHEALFWISSTGFLFNAVFALLSLLFFIFWRERRKMIDLIICVVCIAFSLLFHEVGVIVPILIILYNTVFGQRDSAALPRKNLYLILLSPLLPYTLLRLLAHSHWFNGDYSYSLVKLPFNFIGNAIGYFSLILFGPASLPVYEKLRLFSKTHLVFSLLGSILLVLFFIAGYRLCVKKMPFAEKKILIFGFLFFLISLLPFLGLGNITSRYSYLPSFGFVLIFVLFLKKAYDYLLNNGKYIAVLSIIVIVIVFASSQLFQLQKIQSDWRAAGEKSKSILTSLDYIYAHYSTADTKQLYFINVPIRQADAWVFPVGLNDAVWLVFRNEDIKAHQVSSAEQAFSLMGITSGRVFKFDDGGKLVEMIKAKSGEIAPVAQ